MNSVGYHMNETEPKRVMRSSDVLDLCTALEKKGITVWIDGGWAVDALLGEETRAHGDLDVAIEQQQVEQLRKLLGDQGYSEIKLEEARPHNFVLADNKGHEMDVHVIVIDEYGNGIYGPAENGEMYPAASLTGSGEISGHPVKSISAEYMVKFVAPWIHKHPHKYIPDVAALCEKYSIELPEEYLSYKESKNQINTSQT